MLLSLIAVVVSQLARCAASTLPCGGSQNVYVCNIHDPSKFDICIGEHKYTMSCPGGLHFNTLRQVCDWPQNADCGRQQQQHAPDPPRLAGDSRMVQGEDADSNWRLQAHGAPSNKLLAEKEGPPSREERWWNKGDESVSPDTGKGRDVAARDYSRHRSRENDISDDREVDDRFQLVHYPWWTSRGASPVALRNRFPMPVPGPRTPSRANDDMASRPGSEPRAQYRQALELNHRPAAPPRRKLQPPLPPPPGSQQVPQQQPLSASAPIAAAAASEPKRSKKPQKTGKCSEHTCRLPDCRCIGTDIPGSLPVNETPQMVMLTFDDSVNVANYDYFTQLFDGKFRNPNGCPIRGTFFVSGDATQYHFVEKLHKQGQEIASHSVTHRSPTTYWAHAGYDGYVEEIEGMRKKLAEASNIPRESIRGMRVPFLQVGGDDQYQMLEDFGFTYDTSMVTGNLYKDSNPPIWPFTLDYPPDSKTCSLTPCPTKSYPGLWEVPLIRWYGTNRLACAMPDGCTIGGGRVGTLQFLQDNFRRHYDTNRAPFGIFLHASWFRRKEGNLEGLMDFLQEMSQMKDVWVISVSQVIDWMRSPETNSRAGKLDSWTC